MITTRSEAILRHIVEQYIERAVPVPSLNVAHDSKLGLSPATIRNEMATLEEEGYIYRPHTSAGSVPSDKGYRTYVESLRVVTLSPIEQRLISHLFHQVEREITKWLGLAATLLAQQVKNVAVVSIPRPVDSRFKRVELVSLQDSLALAVLVLLGAKVKEKLLTFDKAVTQPDLARISNKLNEACSGLNRHRIEGKTRDMGETERQVARHILGMMQTEDEQELEETLLEGWQYILSQPEFARSDRMRPLMELVEYRKLLKSIVPEGLDECGVRVIIGKENREETIQNYSVVLCRYGRPDEAVGTIGVVGPTRMPYARTISTVDYLSNVLSELIGSLYGRETHTRERN